MMVIGASVDCFVCRNLVIRLGRAVMFTRMMIARLARVIVARLLI